MGQTKRKCFPQTAATTCCWILLGSSVMGMSQADQVVISPDGSMESLHASASSAFSSATTSTTYGVDVSWPMQHAQVSTKERPLGDAIQDTYTDYLRGCQQQPNIKNGFCETYESDRLEMNLLQPRSMENYTHAGFAKVKAPAPVMTLLQKFWNANHGNEVEEVWDKGNTYVNHWDAPTSILDLGRSDLSEKSGMTDQQRWMIVQQVKAVLEQWTRQSLVFTSLYGIRVYHTGAILAPHVDRLPLVSSAIINVAQEGDDAEPWILEVIGHNGKAVNLTMEPGDMLLYESHSVIHGRPFPLQGNYYANVFFHFEPFGHTARHSQKNAFGSDDVVYEEHTKAAYEKALEREQQKQYDDDHENERDETTSSPGLPPYIQPSEEVQWKQQFYFDREAGVSPKPTQSALGLVRVHSAAADGDVEALKEIAAKDRSQLFKADHNGWRPLHEAARGGRVAALTYLIQEGAQINERTNHGEGGNALWWAERRPGENREAIQLLKKHGAVSLSPISSKTRS